MSRIPPEFLLVADCCRWPVNAQPKLPPSNAAEIDWQRVVRIARRHRVEGLVWNSLTTRSAAVAADAARFLQNAKNHIAQRNLRDARESLYLYSAFQSAGIPLLFLKGVTLALLAYGTLSLKAAHDIDLLVNSDDVDSAAAILRTAGYTCTHPQCAADRLREWHSLSNQSVWRHSGRGTMVELHGRLFNNPRLQPATSLEGGQMVRIGDSFLPTLATDDLFAYLCFHGAVSGWSRLKWLADFAALIAPMDGEQISMFHRRAESMGAGRAAAVALLLSEGVLGRALPGALKQRLHQDPIARGLAWASLRKMTGRYTDSEITDHRLGTLSIHLMQPLLRSEWRFALGEARRLCSRAEDQFDLAGNTRWKSLRPLRLLARKLARPFGFNPASY